MKNKNILICFSLLILCSCAKNHPTSIAAQTPTAIIKPTKTSAPEGVYKLDKSHASLIFKVDHLGLSKYTARFKRFDAELKFDPKNPELSTLSATIDPTSIETDYPDSATHDFNAQLQDDRWLDSAKFPKITFTSTKIELTSSDTARVTGNLDLHGVTLPVTFDVTFNGGYSKIPMDKNRARIGFSAHGALKRSDFKISYGLPIIGTKMGVGNEVEFVIEAEFTKSKSN